MFVLNCVHSHFFFSLCVVEVMAKASFRPISQWLDRALIKVYQLQFGLHYFFFFSFFIWLQDFVWGNQLDVRLKGAAGAAHWFGWNHREEMREKRERTGERGEEKNHFHKKWELPYGRSRCDFFLYSACVLSLPVPADRDGNATIRVWAAWSIILK